jgi:cytochrome c oxidase assembly protein subunit 15
MKTAPGTESDPVSEEPTGMPPAVGLWLLAVAGLVAAMILLGGATRLTESGLAIVRWQPVSGVLPPLDAAGWLREFEAYRQFPEYRQLKRGMSLDEFKTIYRFEYAHRLLGRAIGAAFLLPFLWFLARGRLPSRLAWRLAGIFLLGALQALIGWWMVRSGLVDRPDVSQYRLAVHLGLAFAILGLLLAAGWRALWPAQPARDRYAWAVLALVYLQVLSGALVAGLDAGLHYNTFPTMDGFWLPPELWAQAPGWSNPFENPTTVQFDHRLGACLVALAVLALAWRQRGRGAALLLAALALQFGLGIATLVLQVPVTLGVAHQAGAILLFVAVLWLAERGGSAVR